MQGAELLSHSLCSYYAQALEAAQSIAVKVQRSAMKNSENSIKCDNPYAIFSSKRETPYIHARLIFRLPIFTQISQFFHVLFPSLCRSFHGVFVSAAFLLSGFRILRCTESAAKRQTVQLISSLEAKPASDLVLPFGIFKRRFLPILYCLSFPR